MLGTAEAGERSPLSCGLAGAGPGGGCEVSQVSQQKQNAQLTSAWWRRMAMSERTWKLAQPSSRPTLWLEG